MAGALRFLGRCEGAVGPAAVAHHPRCIAGAVAVRRVLGTVGVLVLALELRPLAGKHLHVCGLCATPRPLKLA